MIIKFHNLKIKQDVEYNGIVTDVQVDEERGRIRIFVTLEEVPGEPYMKSIQFSRSRNGQAGRFFDELGLMDSKGNVELNDLLNKEVIVTLSQGKDSYWYVDQLWLAESSDDSDDLDDIDEEEDDLDDLDDLDEEEDEPEEKPILKGTGGKLPRGKRRLGKPRSEW